ncbi:hypothetical protein B0H17DRAFT_1199012 [Mycena rosella]|uniref:Uncharacterized protein n=1 Tax=Mycena rosella TaxID=1033263 RepID=A0AAD7DM12_MYCRO|nr:hypothetical protein B0H17DRAFT_1199012 [Mycena rosella]
MSTPGVPASATNLQLPLPPAFNPELTPCPARCPRVIRDHVCTRSLCRYACLIRDHLRALLAARASSTTTSAGSRHIRDHLRAPRSLHVHHLRSRPWALNTSTLRSLHAAIDTNILPTTHGVYAAKLTFLYLDLPGAASTMARGRKPLNPEDRAEGRKAALNRYSNKNREALRDAARLRMQRKRAALANTDQTTIQNEALKTREAASKYRHRNREHIRTKNARRRAREGMKTSSARPSPEPLPKTQWPSSHKKLIAKSGKGGKHRAKSSEEEASEADEEQGGHGSANPYFPGRAPHEESRTDLVCPAGCDEDACEGYRRLLCSPAYFPDHGHESIDHPGPFYAFLSGPMHGIVTSQSAVDSVLHIDPKAHYVEAKNYAAAMQIWNSNCVENHDHMRDHIDPPAVPISPAKLTRRVIQSHQAALAAHVDEHRRVALAPRTVLTPEDRERIAGIYRNAHAAFPALGEERARYTALVLRIDRQLQALDVEDVHQLLDAATVDAGSDELSLILNARGDNERPPLSPVVISGSKDEEEGEGQEADSKAIEDEAQRLSALQDNEDEERRMHALEGW